jgi:hypothetical protein
MHLISYASFEDEVLYSKSELARMEKHKQGIEVLISDPSFNAKCHEGEFTQRERYSKISRF